MADDEIISKLYELQRRIYALERCIYGIRLDMNNIINVGDLVEVKIPLSDNITQRKRFIIDSITKGESHDNK